MKSVAKTISYVGLALTIVPSVLVFRGVIGMPANLAIMVLGMFCWFGAAPFWIKRDRSGS